MMGETNLKPCVLMSIFLLAMGGTAATGRTIYVGDDGPVDFNNIQAAIDDSNDGDTIIVRDGIYYENINFGGKNIILCSTDPTDPSVVANTVIDMMGAWDSVVTFAGTESASCMLSGFTITNGWDFYGGGIFGNGTLATIQYNIISGNQAGGLCPVCGGSGGGLYDCDGTIQYNVISRNQVFTNEGVAEGGGLYGCDGTIKNNIIVYNRVIGLGWVRGGGFADCHGNIWNNTIFGNSAHQGGGLSNCNSSIRNCIIWGNSGGQIYDSAPDITYSDIEGGYSGTSNIDADPCFADPCNGDYHLKSQAGRWEPSSQTWVQDEVTSPCIDAGNPGCPLGDEPAPNGNRKNMGAYGGTAEASKSPPNWRSIADLTNDWVVDVNDLGVFVSYWLETGECIPSDLNRNQSVDFADFALMALRWIQER